MELTEQDEQIYHMLAMVCVYFYMQQAIGDERESSYVVLDYLSTRPHRDINIQYGVQTGHRMSVVSYLMAYIRPYFYKQIKKINNYAAYVGGVTNSIFG